MLHLSPNSTFSGFDFGHLEQRYDNVGILFFRFPRNYTTHFAKERKTGQKLKKKLNPRRKHIRKKEPGNRLSHYYHVKNCFFHFSKVDHTRKSLFFRILSDNEPYRNVVMNNEFDISLSRYQFKRAVFTIFSVQYFPKNLW